MDKFEQLIHDVSEMSADDQNKAIGGYKGKCICPTCPTWNQCAGEANEKLSCVMGKSKDCITQLKGCECPVCPFAQSIDIGVERNSFCINGSEMEQRDK
jgi:hypothetical protein